MSPCFEQGLTLAPTDLKVCGGFNSPTASELAREPRGHRLRHAGERLAGRSAGRAPRDLRRMDRGHRVVSWSPGKTGGIFGTCVGWGFQEISLVGASSGNRLFQTAGHQSIAFFEGEIQSLWASCPQVIRVEIQSPLASCWEGPCPAPTLRHGFKSMVTNKHPSVWFMENVGQVPFTFIHSCNNLDHTRFIGHLPKYDFGRPWVLII